MIKVYNRRQKKVIPSDKLVDKKMQIYSNKTKSLYKRIIDDNIQDAYMDYFDNMNKESVKIEVAIEGDESPELYQTNDLSARHSKPFHEMIQVA